MKMSTNIFMCLFAELDSLHHVDEAWLEFELKVVGFECWSSADVLGAWSSEFTQRLEFKSRLLVLSVVLPLDWFDCG